MTRSCSCAVAFLTAIIVATSAVAAKADGILLSPESAVRKAGSLEEFTVTADRRPSRFTMTMASQDRYDAEEIRFIDADHISELLNRSASVNFHRGNGVEYLGAIRSPVLNGGAGAGSFLLLEDSIGTRAAGFANVNGLAETFFETAQSIELIKGPGSALYGSNAVHGLVNIISPDPIAGAQSVRASAGSFGFSQLSLGLNRNAKNNDFRLDAFVARDDGFRDSSGFDQQKIKVQHLRTIDDTQVHTVINAFNVNQNTAGFLQGDDAYRNKTFSRTNAFPEAYRDWRSFRVHQRWIKETSDSSMIVTPYARSNDMEFLQHFLPGQALEKNGHDSVGWQSAYYLDDINNHSLSMGVDGEYTEGYLNVFQLAPDAGFGQPYPQGVHYDFEVDSYSGSLFLQDRVSLSEALILEMGLRGEYVRYDYDNKASVGVFGRIQRIDDRRDEFFSLTPKLSASYRIDDASSLALKLSRGARAPQVNDLYRVQYLQQGAATQVEKINALEFSYHFAVDEFSFLLNTYFMKKKNFFFRDADGLNVTNGRTSHRGLEVDMGMPLGSGFRLDASLSYAKHHYEFNRFGARENITKGDAVDSAPERMANIRLSYKSDIVEQSLEWRHVGRYYTDAANNNDYPGHAILVWRSDIQVEERTNLFWRVNNLFDRRYADRADFAFGNERFFPGAPRSAFVGVEYSLD